MNTPRKVARLWFLLFGGYAALADGRAAAGVLLPRWTCELPNGIEWCKPVEARGRRLLLTCDRESRLHLLDFDAGEFDPDLPSRDILELGAGLRFAGQAADVIFLHNRTDIYAVRIEPSEDASSPRLAKLWHLPASLDRPTNDDPEFLLRIVAAKPFANGLLVLRSDGACVLLNGEDGQPTQRRRFPPTNVCELHVVGARAAMWRKHELEIRVAFWDSENADADPREIELAHPPPIWSKLCGAGLVLVWKERFGVVRPDGAAWIEPLPKEAYATANTACVVSVVSSMRDDEAAFRPRAHLFIPTIDGNLWGYDLDARRKIFEKIGAPSSDRRPRHPRVLRDSDGVLVLEGWMEEAAAYRPAHAEPWLVIRRPDATVRGAHVHAGVMYALFAEKSEVEPTDQQASPAPLVLFREPLPATNPSAVPDARSGARAAYRIDASFDASVLWIADSLLLVENERIRAYTLP